MYLPTAGGEGHIAHLLWLRLKPSGRKLLGSGQENGKSTRREPKCQIEGLTLPLGQSHDAGPKIEAFVACQDAMHPVSFHQGDVQTVPSRESGLRP